MTMKTLYLIRHAKSSWDDLLLDDFERPLNERGKHNAVLMWEKLKEKWIYPDIVISSPAKRARKTIGKICKVIWYNKDKIKFEEWIYDNHMHWIDFYLALIMWINKKKDSVFLVWHNPVFGELANYLLWKDIWNIPTCWIVAIKFDLDNWGDVSYWTWKQEFFIYPKMY